MKFNRAIHLGFVIVFSIFIAIPVLFTILQIEVTPYDPNEKKISLNFKRNFPLKKDLHKLNWAIIYDLFKKDPLPARVVNGRDGWKFLGDYFSNVIYESKGIKVFTHEELHQFGKELIRQKEIVEENGGKFYFVMGPNKLTIYDDKLPLSSMDRKTKLQQVDSLCSAIGIDYIDVTTVLQDRKKDIRLYHKTDTHWNDFAGYLAYQEMVKRIGKDFPDHDIPLYTERDIVIDTLITPMGDLNEMLRLPKSEATIEVNLKNPAAFDSIPDQFAVRPGYHNKPNFYESRFESPINDLKFMMMHDSYIDYVRDYLKVGFGKSIFIWDFHFKEEQVIKERPDI
ncbi:MAG: hypothetical protein WBA16_10085, partial [Nonlabens sp.]